MQYCIFNKFFRSVGSGASWFCRCCRRLVSLTIIDHQKVGMHTSTYLHI